MPLRELLDTSFMAKGACRGLRHIMFPADDITGHDRSVAYQSAARICAGCTVLDACLDWALMDPDPIDGGVVAGLTPNQLAEARKDRAMARRDNYIPKCGTERGYVWHSERGEDCDVCIDAHNRRGQRYAS